MPIEVLNLAIQSGVGTFLACVVIYWYRADWKERMKAEKERTAEAKQRTQEARDEKNRVIDVLSNNAAALSEMSSALRDNAGATRELRTVVQQAMLNRTFHADGGDGD